MRTSCHFSKVEGRHATCSYNILGRTTTNTGRGIDQRNSMQYRRWTASFRLMECRRRQELQNLATMAAASTAEPSEINSEAEVERDVALLKQAANTMAVPSAAVLSALMRLEKKKLANDSYADLIGGGKDGRRWKLTFLSNAKIVQKAQKGEKGGGFYFPISAAQKDEGVIQNGIYLGQIAAIVFKGPYEYAKNKLSFDFSQIKLRLGPKWFTYDVKTMKKEGKAGPFFIMIYVDDEIVAAKGRGGGIAIWQRAKPEWELKAGVTL